ncbi:hypothetical protein CLV51_102108 [Chitinophaga niastensis]|uniref:Uncharacterized protein n=1 Tax=Chitinophaga niastensis TaxID=536980 RepID=A0A2P8HM26_CHINA|nr:hypothetical protein [Chitinophaga niastensis]PSL47263.1 hypothetical protein CLV51_102108 [Chitinophaga niastensis]
MKKLLLIIVVALTGLYACNKKSDTTTTPPPAVIDPKDPQALVSAIKVYHGTLNKGALPATTGGTLTLSVDSYQAVIPAINGRYAVIPLSLASGLGTDVKGAYLKVSGSDSYFNIDFSKPRTARKANSKRPAIFARDSVSYVDSLIIIKLPDNTKSDTFRVEFEVYGNNQVSNIVTAIIQVMKGGGDGDAGKALAGTWEVSRFKDLGSLDTTWQPPFQHYSDTAVFWCHNNKLVNMFLDTLDVQLSLPVYSYRDTKNEITFNASGIGSGEDAGTETRLDTAQSNCSNQAYKDSIISDKGTFGWSYNPATKLLTIVYDQDANADFNDFSVEAVSVDVIGNKLYFNGATITEFLKK